MDNSPTSHLTILEKICESNAWITCYDDGDDGSYRAMYIYTSGIYNTWCKGSELEKQLADDLVAVWQEELEYRMRIAYGDTKHSPGRPEADEFYQSWCYTMKKKFHNHLGLQRAVFKLCFDTLKHTMS
jgi:hypothetical protein